MYKVHGMLYEVYKAKVLFDQSILESVILNLQSVKYQALRETTKKLNFFSFLSNLMAVKQCTGREGVIFWAILLVFYSSFRV